MREKLIASERIFDGQILNLRVDTVQLPDGRRTTREVVEHKGAVGMVALTDSGEIVLVRQYRRAPDEVLLEIPAGRLEPGERPEDCARRELAEEIGRVPSQLEKLGELYSAPGYSQELLHLFLAGGLKEAEGCRDPDELMEIVEVRLQDAVEMCSQAEIRDLKTAAGIALAVRFLEG